MHKVADISCSGYSIRYVPGPTCRGSVSLYVPPWAIKGRARNVTTHTQLRLSALKLPQQSNTQWSRVLRSGGPNHSKPSRVLVFGHRLAGQAKHLSPFLILGLRAGALCHPAGKFSLRHLARQVGVAWPRGLTSGSARWLTSRAIGHVVASGPRLSGERKRTGQSPDKCLRRTSVRPWPRSGYSSSRNLAVGGPDLT
jgi:hypothetical protein